MRRLSGFLLAATSALTGLFTPVAYSGGGGRTVAAGKPKRVKRFKMARPVVGRSRYVPHQGPRECARRVRQMAVRDGRLEDAYVRAGGEI